MTGFGRPLRAATAVRATRSAVAAGLLGVSVLAFAATASATAGDTVAVDGSTQVTVTSDKQLSVSATAQPTCITGLTARVVTVTLTGPKGSDSTSTKLATKPGMCNHKVELEPTFASPARNGSYTVTLRNGSASNITTASVAVKVPPAKVKHFRAASDGTEATFAWTVSPEPDVVEYKISTASGRAVETVTASSACGHETTCAARIDLGSAVAGHTESFVIRAVRCGISCSQHLPGPVSAAASAHFTTSSPPPPPVTVPPASVVTAPAATNPPASPSAPPTKRSHPQHSSTPASGTSSMPVAVGGSSTPATGVSSAPAKVSPPASAGSLPSSATAGSSSSAGNDSGGDWAVRGIAIVVVLGALAMFVRALSARTSSA